ncbi:MAG: hypothetical protein IPM52_10865 [Bacteroidetes bacterium]|nr:hypothetical protein [Bacteroidota bacterium]
MQPDPLEQFIRNNRSLFDELVPGEKLWIRIAQKLNHQRLLNPDEISGMLKINDKEKNDGQK